MISFRHTIAISAIALAMAACGAEKPVADVPVAETPEPVETPVVESAPDGGMTGPMTTCVQKDGTVDLVCCQENELRPEGCTPCSPDRETACLTCRQAGQIISPEAEVACCEAYRLRGDERCPHDD